MKSSEKVRKICCVEWDHCCAFNRRSATAVTSAAPFPLPSYDSAKSTSIFESSHSCLVIWSMRSAKVGCFLYTVPSTPHVMWHLSPCLICPLARWFSAILCATADIPDAQRWAALLETAWQTLVTTSQSALFASKRSNEANTFWVAVMSLVQLSWLWWEASMYLRMYRASPSICETKEVSNFP